MHAPRTYLLGLLVVLVLSAKSSAYFAAPLAVEAHSGHRSHDLRYMQDTTALAPKDRPVTMPSIDGSKNPELIPDSVAYGHFIRAIASSGSAVDIARREAFLTRAGLSSADRVAFSQAIGHLQAQLDNVKQERAAGGPSLSRSALEQLKQTEDLALSAAQSRIQSALSVAGVVQLDSHIQEHVKRRIKIYTFSMK